MGSSRRAAPFIWMAPGSASADTAGMQLLVAFSREAEMRNVEIIWRGASEVLLQSAAGLGLSVLLGLAAPNEAT